MRFNSIMFFIFAEIFSPKLKTYEKEHGNHRHYDQVNDCGPGYRFVLHSRDIRHIRNNSAGLCWNFRTYKHIRHLPIIFAFRNQHPKQGIGKSIR